MALRLALGIGTIALSLAAFAPAALGATAAEVEAAARARVLAAAHAAEAAPKLRFAAREPALFAAPQGGGAYQWQYAATRSNNVPAWALRRAARITIAVIDTGADLAAPDLAAKGPAAFDVVSGGTDVSDALGHGTFVASLAAGSVTNRDGIAGFGGDARLLVVKAGSNGTITDVDEARAIVYAVDHGARIINLSFGGRDASPVERRAIDYAVARGVLVVAAAGNEFREGNAVQYPAALLQPPGSNGRGGAGLVVAGSTRSGTRAPFSNTGSHVSLAAPAENVFGAISSLSPTTLFPRVPLPGSLAGLYGYGSGTSFAAPQVAGAAALVWGARPTLAAAEVARILEESAQGRGRWNPELGFGVIDVARAVATAASTPLPRTRGPRS